MKTKITITESELVSIVKKVLMEQYNPDDLYPKQYVVAQLKDAPRELRKYIKNLPDIPCENDKGVRTICTKIPEVIHIYITGRY